MSDSLLENLTHSDKTMFKVYDEVCIHKLITLKIRRQRVIKYIPIVFLMLSACATHGDKLSKSDKLKVINGIDGATAITVKDRHGNTSQYTFAQKADFSFKMLKEEFVLAKACEDFASRPSPKETWLQICDEALKEPKLNAYNQSAIQFNKALMLAKLGDVSGSMAVLTSIVEDNPQFSEADFEIARLNYAAKNYPETIKYAEAAISKGLLRSSRAYYVIGQSYEYDFHFSDARTAYETGLKKSPNSQRLQNSLKRLNRLWPEK